MLVSFAQHRIHKQSRKLRSNGDSNGTVHNTHNNTTNTNNSVCNANDDIINNKHTNNVINTTDNK